MTQGKSAGVFLPRSEQRHCITATGRAVSSSQSVVCHWLWKGQPVKNRFSLQTYPPAFLIQCLRNHRVEGVVANITTNSGPVLWLSFLSVTNFCAVPFFFFFFLRCQNPKGFLKSFQAALLQKHLCFFLLPPCLISCSKMICVAHPLRSAATDGRGMPQCFFPEDFQSQCSRQPKKGQKKRCAMQRLPNGPVGTWWQRRISWFLVQWTVLSWGPVASSCWLILTCIMRNCFISWLYQCSSQRHIGSGDLEVKLKTFRLSFRQIDLE